MITDYSMFKAGFAEADYTLLVVSLSLTLHI